MIKFKRCAMVMAFTMMVCAAQASLQAAEFDSALTGRVSMEGSIFSTPCDMNTGNDYQVIEMPTDTRTHIKRVGEGEPKNFSIYLTNCSLDLAESSQYLRIIFDSDEDTGLFRVNGSASGVALELMDRNGNVIRPGIATPYQQVSDDDNRFDYQLRLKSNMRNLMVGEYSAIIRYRVEYF